MTFTVGNVTQIIVTVGGLLAAYTKLRERLTRIETQIEPMWREFERRRGATRDRERGT